MHDNYRDDEREQLEYKLDGDVLLFHAGTRLDVRREIDGCVRGNILARHKVVVSGRIESLLVEFGVEVQ